MFSGEACGTEPLLPADSVPPAAANDHLDGIVRLCFPFCGSMSSKIGCSDGHRPRVSESATAEAAQLDEVTHLGVELWIGQSILAAMMKYDRMKCDR